MKFTRMLFAVALTATALTTGCRQSRDYAGGGAAFPPPMAGAAAPIARDRAVTILPPENVPITVTSHQ
jgi:hypothetical protein